MIKVKLKDGRTGTIVTETDKVATINVDATSKEAGGMIQVSVDEIAERSNAGTTLPVKETEKPTPAPATAVTDDPGVMALAGSAALLQPVFVSALASALQEPSVIQALRKAMQNDQAAKPARTKENARKPAKKAAKKSK